jgi:hypothetical protein
MLARGIHNAFHAKLLRPYHPDTALDRTPVVPLLYNSLTDIPNTKLTKSSDTASTAGNPNIQSTGKAMVNTKTLGYPLSTSAALNSLLTFIEPRTALPQGGDDDRFHLSTAMCRHAIYRYATFKLHLSIPHIDMPRILLPCHPHHNT